MSSKFFNNLTASNKQIKESRAKLIAEDAEQALKDLVNDLTKEVRDLKRKQMDLEDLSPDSIGSLKPGGDNFDPKEWALSIVGTKLELIMKQEELDNAENVLKEYFGNEAEK